MPPDRAIPIKSTFSHAELADKHFEPVIWGIKGLVPAGVSILASKPKIGKSWAALQMCMAKATGSALWAGREPEDRGDALYIALEDNQRRLKQRSNRQFSQYVSRDDEGNVRWQGKGLPNLHFAIEWPRIGKGGIRQLAQWLSSHPDCQLVVIDTLARFRADRPNKNAYEEDYQVGERLKRLTDKFSVAILLIHHTRKMDADDPFDAISGSQGLAGSVDAALVLTRIRGSSDAGLFVTGRDIEYEVELAIQFDKSECRWVSSGISVQEATLGESRRVILDAIRTASEPLTIKQIRSQLSDDGINKTAETVRKTVQRMVTDYQLEKTEGNTYRACLSHVSSYD